jgi:hypothetical protein
MAPLGCPSVTLPLSGSAQALLLPLPHPCGVEPATLSRRHWFLDLTCPACVCVCLVWCVRACACACADVIITAPASGATFAQGDSVLIQWDLNPAVRQCPLRYVSHAGLLLFSLDA